MTLDVLIQFWSATGNTRLAAELAAEGLKEAGASVEMQDLRRRPSKAIPEVGLWVVASPVYAFRPAIPVEEHLAEARSRGTLAAGILTHCGFPDRAGNHLENGFRAAGARPWRCVRIQCEDAWPVLRRLAPEMAITGLPDHAARRRFAQWWASVPERLARGEPGGGWRRVPTPFTLLKPIYRRRVLRCVLHIRVDADRCIRCGECERRCPTGRMSISRFPRPRGDCVGCYGCVNICPVNAVNTWLTRGAPRYRGPSPEGAAS